MATHSHPHPHPHPHSPGPSPGPGPMPINPALTALLDSIPTNTLPFALVSVPLPIPPNATLPPGATPPTQTLVVCPTHKNVICEQCGVDYGGLNYMQQFLKDAPTEAVPPPPNMQPPQGRADAIKNAKDAGNRPAWEYIIYGSPGMGKKEARGTRDELDRRPETAFKANNFPTAIRAYSQSADMALSRPPWELAALGREETAIALCNRSAAFALAGEWVNALADAEAVVTLKRPWTRGHYRRARALVGLNRYEEARQAAVDGLQYEPNDKDLNAVLKEMDSKIVEQA